MKRRQSRPICSSDKHWAGEEESELAEQPSALDSRNAGGVSPVTIPYQRKGRIYAAWARSPYDV